MFLNNMAQTNPHGNKKKTGNKVLYTSASFAAVLPPCEFVYVTNYALATPNKNSIGKTLWLLILGVYLS